LRSLKDFPNEWENANLEDFLSALAAWVEDMDGYFENRSEPPPKTSVWKLIGQMLLAARIYE
jgi:hypothetical protein